MADRFEIAVAGVTFDGRQEMLRKLWRAQEAGAELSVMLEAEPDNPHHRTGNALKIIAFATKFAADGNSRWPEKHIGYVPKPIAEKLAPRLRKGETATVVEVRILRGGDPPGYGARVRVDVGQPVQVAVLTEEERGGF